MDACLCCTSSWGRSIKRVLHLDVLLLFTAAGLLGNFTWSSVIRGKRDTVLELLGLFSFSGDSSCWVGLPVEGTLHWTLNSPTGCLPPSVNALSCVFLLSSGVSSLWIFWTFSLLLAYPCLTHGLYYSHFCRTGRLLCHCCTTQDGAFCCFAMAMLSPTSAFTTSSRLFFWNRLD